MYGIYLHALGLSGLTIMSRTGLVNIWVKAITTMTRLCNSEAFFSKNMSSVVILSRPGYHLFYSLFMLHVVAIYNAFALYRYNGFRSLLKVFSRLIKKLHVRTELPPLKKKLICL